MEAIKMLVLSRRNGSGIKIGSDVTVTVLASRSDRVRLGVEAPDHVRILRDELVEEPQAESPPADADRQRDARMKIVLVIEDDPLHARLIRKALCANRGTMVTVAESARRGLVALGASTGSDDVVQPDLILLDMSLPDGSGLEVLRAIRQDDRLRATPVVMLTCCQDDSLVNQCVNTGANAYVVKSPRWNEFRDSVNRIGQFWTNDYFMPKHEYRRTSESSLSARTAEWARVGTG